MNCKICSNRSTLLGRAVVRNAHDASFYQCQTCGFVHIADPLWLSDAYRSVINLSDVGLVSRNLALAQQTAVVVSLWFGGKGRFLDYGGGYGLFVRLMRDSGYDFFRYDSHCENLFARGFDMRSEVNVHFDLLTAFEVFEHLVDPLAEVERMLSHAPSILFSTKLLPEPVRLPNEWWYYGLDHGQHISFYTPASLKVLADRFHLKFYTNGGSLHLLTSRRVMPGMFALLTRYRVANLISLLLPQRSLVADDYRTITGRDLV